MSLFTPALLSIAWAVTKAVIILLVSVLFAAYLSFIERRVLALWQDRYGPNRVGPFGIWQLPADVVKMLFKEDWIPPFADRLTFLIAPVIAMSALLISYCIVPITPTWGSRISISASCFSWRWRGSRYTRCCSRAGRATASTR